MPVPVVLNWKMCPCKTDVKYKYNLKIKCVTKSKSWYKDYPKKSTDRKLCQGLVSKSKRDKGRVNLFNVVKNLTTHALIFIFLFIHMYMFIYYFIYQYNIGYRRSVFFSPIFPRGQNRVTYFFYSLSRVISTSRSLMNFITYIYRYICIGIYIFLSSYHLNSNTDIPLKRDSMSARRSRHSRKIELNIYIPRKNQMSRAYFFKIFYFYY